MKYPELYKYAKKHIGEFKYNSWELPCLQCGHKPDDIDKKSWDKMVEHTCHFMIMLFFVAVVGIVLMMIKDVI